MCENVPLPRKSFRGIALAAGVVHVPDLAEDGSLPPALVVDPADAPHASHVAVRVSPVKLVLIIKVKGDAKRLLWRLCPLQNLLRPVHSHETVHL